MRVLPKVLSILQKPCQVQYLFRKYIKHFSTNYQTREFEEIRLSVPWGHIAGKWYGPKDKRPIVGFHGWQDNAGTFDTLAPLLPPHIGFLSIDLPGHGLSSWLPDGCSYNSMDNIHIFLRLMREYKWDKISMIGHSMSATDAMIFAALYPGKCDIIITLDIIQPLLTKKEITIKELIDKVNAFDKEMKLFHQKTKPPSYEIEELIEKMRKVNQDSIFNECYKFFLKRSIKPSQEEPNKYYLNRDGRLKAIIFSIFPIEIFVEMAHRITCPHLYMKFQRAHHFHTDLELKQITDALKTNKYFENYLIDGSHYVHLNEPHKIAKIVNPFIMKYRPQ